MERIKDREKGKGARREVETEKVR
uniref:Uncharacterized protein n=1 Tax=Anguilla anguilla TaxID=7936 RepID=A0A0E9SJR1_ANGAN